MAEFHNTMMGKQFITSTVPQLVRAVEKLNKNLAPEPIVEYDTMLVMLYANDGGDRQHLERIEGDKFNSIEELHKINENISVYSLSDFTEMCNNIDTECDDLHLMDRWVAHIQLRKGAVLEYQNNNYNRNNGES